MSKIPEKPNALKSIFNREKPLIGTIHCLPFPGAPRYDGESMDEIIDHAVSEATRYETGGMDGVIVENGGDLPFLRPEDIPYETVSILGVVGRAVRNEIDIPVGINLLANGAIPALSVAKSVQADFIRVNQWVNAYVANEGFVQGESAKAMRYRKNINAQNIDIFADVHVKHGSHSIVGDRSVQEQAGDVEFFDADVAIATGNRTGDPTPPEEIKSIQKGTFLPVIIGSGLTADNAPQLLRIAEGAIVGSSLKHEGGWWGTVDVDKVKELVDAVEPLR